MQQQSGHADDLRTGAAGRNPGPTSQGEDA